LINLEGDGIRRIYLLKKSCDRVEKSTIAQMILKSHGRYTEYTMLKKSRDRVEKSTIAARRLKNFAGDTQNINESKINLDS